MRVLALFNIKGGVGKTAAAVNLAHLAAQRGWRTLLWDLDPQGAATFYFRLRAKVKGGAKQLARGERELDPLLRATDFDGLDMLPADFSFRNLDLHLDANAKPTRRLARLLQPLEQEYDLVVLDCAPSISLVSEAIFVAADVLLVPTIPTFLSLRTLRQLERHLAKAKRERVAVWPFFSMVDRRKALHRSIVDEDAGRSPRFLTAQIPYSSAVEQMGSHRAPVQVYAPRSVAAVAYGELWREIEERLTRPAAATSQSSG